MMLMLFAVLILFLSITAALFWLRSCPQCRGVRRYSVRMKGKDMTCCASCGHIFYSERVEEEDSRPVYY